MAWTLLRRVRQKPDLSRNTSGIALFMVIAAVSVLSILITEFTYVAQINQRMAFDSLDQLQAHYLAKSGLKLSLLRLKAYTQVKAVLNTLTGGGGSSTTGGSSSGSKTSPVPESVLDKIWSFPFFYPIPTNIPGMTQGDKDKIKKFEDASGFEGGRFSALIESESSKFNLNGILAQFAPSPVPSTSPSSSPTTPGQTPPPTTTTTPGASPSTSASFSPDEARKSLSDLISQMINNKMQNDPDFMNDYRDFKFDDFMDGLYAWADRTYQRKGNDSLDPVPMKRAPFYSLSELHQLPLMDDQLYNLLTPSLTVSATTGININTMQQNLLNALVPQMTPDELTEFFKFRDATDQDNTFKSTDDFYNYLKTNVAYFKNSDQLIGQLKTNLSQRNIQLVLEESQFKITVQAQVNQATKIIEAYVTLGQLPTPQGSGSPSPSPSPQPTQPQNGGVPNAQPTADPGLRITFMRIL